MKKRTAIEKAIENQLVKLINEEIMNLIRREGPWIERVVEYTLKGPAYTCVLMNYDGRHIVRHDPAEFEQIVERETARWHYWKEFSGRFSAEEWK